jgi:hypothetical protein
LQFLDSVRPDGTTLRSSMVRATRMQLDDSSITVESGIAAAFLAATEKASVSFRKALAAPAEQAHQQYRPSYRQHHNDRRDRDYKRQRSRSRSPRERCLKCGGSDHHAKDHKKDEERIQGKYNLCGGKGHKKNQCPAA